MGQIIYNENAAGQIKRMAQQAVDIRELCQQHSLQVDQLESWLNCNGIELTSPPPAPRRPPMKRARLADSIESDQTIADWCRQVKAEEADVNLKCTSCSVVIPNSLNRLLKTINKKTRRNIADICNTFQYVVGEGAQENLEVPEGLTDVKPAEKLESCDEKKQDTDNVPALQPTAGTSKSFGEAGSSPAESSERSGVLDLTGKSARRCAAKFGGQNEVKPEEKQEILRPLEDIFEFQYNEEDEGNLMRRVTFRICDYVDAVARRVFLDPWIPYGYSGEDQITKVVEANMEGAVRDVSRRYVAQPWRQFKGTPFHFTQEVDVTYILPSGQLLIVPLGYC